MAASARRTMDRRSPRWIWRRSIRGLTPVNMTTNTPNGDGDFHTFEITGTKRMSNRWALLASYGYTKSFDNNNMVYLGNTVRQNFLPATPNDEINTTDGRHEYSRQNAKLSGTWASPWFGISFSPMLRYQQGFPYGRTFAATLRLRQRPLPRRAVRHAAAGRHHHHRPAHREVGDASPAVVMCRCSSTSTTCSTRTPSRTCSGARAPRSIVRSASCRRAWRASG